ncbi:hypothetical protein [Paraburkholderia ginsengisoli]|uniref:Uncharacterized protein n=1 Tax=Paraburkholderia ginsengisoli TaxID=311231 RepID=A0A7T4N9R7_9BURK|nr:hypothetical protein [Paraburkholderia ginsengisoli]QQC67840.1 hypothetical protein I6I06_20530 [Paraburkholderia ginsengisoli]
MASSAAAIWDGVRHPRTFLRHWATHVSAARLRSYEAMAASAHGSNSPERLERIAAYARCGYFHMEYTAGMFVVPLDIARE